MNNKITKKILEKHEFISMNEIDYKIYEEKIQFENLKEYEHLVITKTDGYVLIIFYNEDNELFFYVNQLNEIKEGVLWRLYVSYSLPDGDSEEIQINESNINNFNNRLLKKLFEIKFEINNYMNKYKPLRLKILLENKEF